MAVATAMDRPIARAVAAVRIILPPLLLILLPLTRYLDTHAKKIALAEPWNKFLVRRSVRSADKFMCTVQKLPSDTTDTMDFVAAAAPAAAAVAAASAAAATAAW